MKAMVLAAGVGSRLRPLTDKVPKALVDINGVPMIELVIGRLRKAGVTELIINLHHLPELVVDFLESKRNFGLRIEYSREDVLLDTGGGLKKAAGFFDDGRPFLLHNVDVLSEIDLESMIRLHESGGALATLAVEDRPSSRRLLFSGGKLCGWRKGDKIEWAGAPAAKFDSLAFNGIHVISPELLPLMAETGAFSINQTYLRLAGEGRPIQAFRSDGFYWVDVGSPQSLEAARRRVKTF